MTKRNTRKREASFLVWFDGEQYSNYDYRSLSSLIDQQIPDRIELISFRLAKQDISIFKEILRRKRNFRRKEKIVFLEQRQMSMSIRELFTTFDSFKFILSNSSRRKRVKIDFICSKFVISTLESIVDKTI